MNTIDNNYIYYFRDKYGDINEHFPVLRKYAKQCDTIIECGTRRIVSTWALLAGRPKTMLSVDIEHPTFYGGDLDRVFHACEEEGITFKFAKISSLELKIISVDLLFLDTHHSYEQINQELKLHASNVKKFIIIHDTNIPEAMAAVADFIIENKDWVTTEILTNQNGLTVLERVNNR